MPTPIRLPDLGGGPVTLSHWYAEPGERVLAGERLVEVLTDGATFEVTAPATGPPPEKPPLPRDPPPPGPGPRRPPGGRGPCRGPSLSLDGIDGTGKSSQIALLADWLTDRGWNVVCCADPGGTAIGDRIRDILLNQRHEMSAMAEALLFMASRAELIARVIRPALAAGSLVLSDRYLLATVVYQGHGGGLDVDDLWSIGRGAAGGMEPDLTVVLDLSVQQARARRGRSADRLESRQVDYHERVRDGFLAEAERDPQRIRVVSAAGSVDEVQARIRAEVERVVAARPRA